MLVTILRLGWIKRSLVTWLDLYDLDIFQRPLYFAWDISVTILRWGWINRFG